MSYRDLNSPRSRSRNHSDGERYNRLVQETSKGIASFNQVTRSIAQKMSLFGTPQDSRANHEQLKDLTAKGNKLVNRINKRLHDLNRSGASGGPNARARKMQVSKLSSDFKNQVRTFEDVCQKLMDSETETIETIRRSSVAFKHDKKSSGGGGGGNNFNFGNYNEEQLYAQVNITNYDEEDLARREEDIIHINHQLREVNAAFQEIDGLVQDQGETVVEITENTDTAKENVEGALENVRQADARTSYCACTKWKLIMYGGLALIVVLIFLTLFKK